MREWPAGMTSSAIFWQQAVQEAHDNGGDDSTTYYVCILNESDQ